MRKLSLATIFLASLLASFVISSQVLFAKTPISTPTPTPTPTPTAVPTPPPVLTEKSEATLGPLETLLKNQKLGPVWPLNPVKYAIRGAVKAGVPANTLVLLLLLPVAAAVIAGARHLIGLRGFGIFLPAALSVVFIATGPVVGIGLFLIIVTVSILSRLVFKKLKIKLQYLPRMALILWLVVLGVLGILFLVPVVKYPALSTVSIFPVLVLALLAEDFTRVQLGKSAKTAINITSETLILALFSYILLTFRPIQQFALLNPEALLILTALFDFFLGKYVGLRVMEIWRFRKLINS
jgi:hypothetical protein